MAEKIVEIFGQDIGGWINGHTGWSIFLFLVVLSLILKILSKLFNIFFKVKKREIDPIGWVFRTFGNALTKSVRDDISNFEKSTNQKFDDIKKDRAASIKKMQDDYNKQISDLKTDIDAFEKATSISLSEMKKGTDLNCTLLKKRMDAMEKSNDLQTVRQIRAHVLDFANSCMNGRKHTKLDFENIMNNENPTYEALCKKHKIKNKVYKADYEYIERCYKKCQDENSFLNEVHEAGA